MRNCDDIKMAPLNKRLAGVLRVAGLLLVIVAAGAAAATSAQVRTKCKTCDSLVANFAKGMDNTRTGNPGGGNTEWEERRLNAWSKSEMRLIEVIEYVCERKDQECHFMLTDIEEKIEDWWYSDDRDQIDLRKHICLDFLKVCCPPGQYGPSCRSCPKSATGLLCNDHGDCDGDGFREGSGKCKCHEGYQSDGCDQCASNYFNSNNTCLKCDDTCLDGCTGAGSKACHECRDGYYRLNPDDACLHCDPACITCVEGGPEGCNGECSHGYQRDGGVCVDVDECEQTDRCVNNHVCENTAGAYICKCPSGTKEERDSCVPEVPSVETSHDPVEKQEL